MVALLRHNPDAFFRADMNALKADAVRELPPARGPVRLAPAEARALFAAQLCPQQGASASKKRRQQSFACASTNRMKEAAPDSRLALVVPFVAADNSNAPTSDFRQRLTQVLADNLAPHGRPKARQWQTSRLEQQAHVVAKRIVSMPDHTPAQPVAAKAPTYRLTALAVQRMAVKVWAPVPPEVTGRRAGRATRPARVLWEASV